MASMSADRFLDRFRFLSAEEQQIQSIGQLYEVINSSVQGAAILDEQARWAVTYSSKPTALTTPKPTPTPAGGLDPRGSEEAGMAGPQMTAPVKPGDFYLLVNDRDQDMEAYDHTVAFLWKIPALARGQGADTDWSRTKTDTPPGLYKLGKLYADYEQNPNPPCSDTDMGYDWYSFDMEELEGQEVAAGRAGIMLHGGGSACGWPGAWAAMQQLHPTLGCVRLHNAELRDRVLPPYRHGTVYVVVFQEKK